MVQPAAALGSYGMLCRASLTSPTLGVALKRWCRHHRLLTDDLVHRLTETGGVAELVIEETRDLGPNARILPDHQRAVRYRLRLLAN
jgi:hypothetical protein